MVLTIVFLPLIVFIISICLGRYLGSIGVSFLTCLSTFLSLLGSWFLFLNIIYTGAVYELPLCDWIYVDSLHVKWCFTIDSLTVVMLIVVTSISSCVHLYSTEYMSEDPHLIRFLSYLSLFTFFMLVLITANNFLQMFVGWEGVGVSSYLLINFWFTRIQANKAAIKAMLLNRVADFTLLLAILSIFLLFKSLDYTIVFTIAPLMLGAEICIGNFIFNIIDIICILLFLGAVGKSAQIGFHTWLPDAMEGPTPVSALIHAATMVTAGVFLICRCSYLFELSFLSLNVVVIVGASTAFFAATTGLFQNDIKKIIAYSTCSQLGYMIFACGLSSYDVGLFHLSNHAFFKALLFLGAGSIIHALGDEQDLRKMGGLKNLLPFSYAIMLIGSLALIGFPFLSGFYSKDVILELSFSKYTHTAHVAYWLGVWAALCTSFYSTRLLYLVFLSKSNSNKKTVLNIHEGSWKMTGPLLILSVFSLFIGFLSKDLFIGFGSDFWGSSLFSTPLTYSGTDIEFLNTIYKITPLYYTVAGGALAFYLYAFRTETYLKYKLSNYFKLGYTFFNKKWFFDRVYTQIFSQQVLDWSLNYFYFKIDRGFLEILGPSGLVCILNELSSLFIFTGVTNVADDIYSFTKMNIHYKYTFNLSFAFAILYFIFILLRVDFDLLIFAPQEWLE